MGYHKANVGGQWIDSSAFGIVKPEVESSIDGGAVEWPVLVVTSEKEIEALTKTISLFGAFIACPEPPPINEELALKISVPDRDPMEIGAKVTWNNSHAEETPKLVRGMGVNFVRISDADRQFIRDAILNNGKNESDEDWFVEC